MAKNAATIAEYNIDHTKLFLKQSLRVMSPSRYSLFIAKNLRVAKNISALDLGSGSGILGIMLAKMGAKKVYAIDIDDYAVKLTDENAKLNSVSSQVTAFQDDMVSTFCTEKFDLIVSNPPSLPIPEEKYAPICYCGGPEGRDFIDRLIIESPKFLKKGGILEFVTSSLTNIKRTKEMLNEYEYKVEIVDKQALKFRSFYLRYYTWFKKLAREGKARYVIRDGVPYEILYLIKAEKLMN